MWYTTEHDNILVSHYLVLRIISQTTDCKGNNAEFTKSQHLLTSHVWLKSTDIEKKIEPLYNYQNSIPGAFSMTNLAACRNTDKIPSGQKPSQVATPTNISRMAKIHGYREENRAAI